MTQHPKSNVRVTGPNNDRTAFEDLDLSSPLPHRWAVEQADSRRCNDTDCWYASVLWIVLCVLCAVCGWAYGTRMQTDARQVEIAPSQITVDTSRPRWSDTSETSAALDDAPKVALPDVP